MKAVFHNRTFLWFLVMVFLITIPHRMNDALFGLYLQSLGASPGMISLAWALAAAGEIPTFALLGRYMNRYHELAVLGLVSVLYTIRWLLYAYIHDPWVLVFLQLTHSVTYAVFWLVAVQYAVRLIPEELRSTGQALLSAVFLGLAGITGGFVGGWFQDEYGGTGMYLFGTVLTAISAVLFLVTHARQRKR
ncbi:MFS transporter [Paenibacillus sp. CC-CFT747]|nr:MFS transporter [Paenibacillus sp. CC-CFT747]